MPNVITAAGFGVSQRGFGRSSNDWPTPLLGALKIRNEGSSESSSHMQNMRKGAGRSKRRTVPCLPAQESAQFEEKMAVALKLGRTYQSVKGKIAALQLSSRIREGYSLNDIQDLIGVNSRKVYGWIRKGWLRLDQGRASDAEMRRFLQRHPEEYVLRRLNEAWFKDIMFSTVRSFRIQDREIDTEVTDTQNRLQAITSPRRTCDQHTYP